jgi:hypothetical protein
LSPSSAEPDSIVIHARNKSTTLILLNLAIALAPTTTESLSSELLNLKN